MSSNRQSPGLKAKSTLSEARWRVLPDGHTPPSAIPECPKNQDETEWIAAKTVAFFIDLSTLVSIVLPDLKNKFTKKGEGFPPGFKFLWVEEGQQTGILLSAPNYIEKCLSWMDSEFENEAVFPVDKSVPFLPEFIELHVCKLFTLMFRNFAILHNSGYSIMEENNCLELFYTTLKHFVFFGIRHNLLVETDEFLAMKSPMRRIQEEYIKEWKATQASQA